LASTSQQGPPNKPRPRLKRQGSELNRKAATLAIQLGQKHRELRGDLDKIKPEQREAFLRGIMRQRNTLSGYLNQRDQIKDPAPKIKTNDQGKDELLEIAKKYVST
jgi:hypothetical protein